MTRIVVFGVSNADKQRPRASGHGGTCSNRQGAAVSRISGLDVQVTA